MRFKQLPEKSPIIVNIRHKKTKQVYNKNSGTRLSFTNIKQPTFASLDRKSNLYLNEDEENLQNNEQFVKFRVFDGKLNETKTEAISNFEKKFGFKIVQGQLLNQDIDSSMNPKDQSTI